MVSNNYTYDTATFPCMCNYTSNTESNPVVGQTGVHSPTNNNNNNSSISSFGGGDLCKCVNDTLTSMYVNLKNTYEQFMTDLPSKVFPLGLSCIDKLVFTSELASIYNTHMRTILFDYIGYAHESDIKELFVKFLQSEQDKYDALVKEYLDTIDAFTTRSLDGIGNPKTERQYAISVEPIEGESIKELHDRIENAKPYKQGVSCFDTFEEHYSEVITFEETEGIGIATMKLQFAIPYELVEWKTPEKHHRISNLPIPELKHDTHNKCEFNCKRLDGETYEQHCACLMIDDTEIPKLTRQPEHQDAICYDLIDDNRLHDFYVMIRDYNESEIYYCEVVTFKEFFEEMEDIEMPSMERQDAIPYEREMYYERFEWETPEEHHHRISNLPIPELKCDTPNKRTFDYKYLDGETYKQYCARLMIDDTMIPPLIRQKNYI